VCEREWGCREESQYRKGGAGRGAPMMATSHSLSKYSGYIYSCPNDPPRESTQMRERARVYTYVCIWVDLSRVASRAFILYSGPHK